MGNIGSFFPSSSSYPLRVCGMSPVIAFLLFTTLSLAMASPASAQTRYSCRDEQGAVYTLARPCPKGMVTSAVSAGPVEPRAEPRSYAPTPSRRSSVMREVPEYESYMSGRCRTLQNSIRGASANGSSYDVIAGMQREYQRDCSDEESDAASRYYRERREARSQRRTEREREEQAQLAQEEQESRKALQCAESKRILAAKRARTDLTPGERNDLRRFETNVITRCGDF